MPPVSPHALRQKALREARQAAALRANLARRKDHKREQTFDARPESGSGFAVTATEAGAAAPDAELAPKGSHR